eukprot:jgi/Bigna1/84703/fgenesh1_pg.229_\
MVNGAGRVPLAIGGASTISVLVAVAAAVASWQMACIYGGSEGPEYREGSVRAITGRHRKECPGLHVAFTLMEEWQLEAARDHLKKGFEEMVHNPLPQQEQTQCLQAMLKLNMDVPFLRAALSLAHRHQQRQQQKGGRREHRDGIREKVAADAQMQGEQSRVWEHTTPEEEEVEEEEEEDESPLDDMLLEAYIETTALCTLDLPTKIGEEGEEEGAGLANDASSSSFEPLHLALYDAPLGVGLSSWCRRLEKKRRREEGDGHGSSSFISCADWQPVLAMLLFVFE